MSYHQLLILIQAKGIAVIKQQDLKYNRDLLHNNARCRSLKSRITLTFASYIEIQKNQEQIFFITMKNKSLFLRKDLYFLICLPAFNSVISLYIYIYFTFNGKLNFLRLNYIYLYIYIYMILYFCLDV